MVALAIAAPVLTLHRDKQKYLQLLIGGSLQEITAKTSKTKTRRTSSQCVGRNDVFPGNRTCLFTNVLLRKNLNSGEWQFSAIAAKGNVSASNGEQVLPVSSEPLYNHNRWALGSAFRLDTESSEIETGYNRTAHAIDDRCLVLVEEHHTNPGHLLWDSMYPSWAALLAVQPDVALDAKRKFQWITVKPVDRSEHDDGGWTFGLLQNFSGYPVLSVDELTKSAVQGSITDDTEIQVNCLVAGVSGRGIAVVGAKGAVELGSGPPPSYYTDAETKTTQKSGDALLDPVLAFRDRMYRTYGLSPPKSIREDILDASNSFGATLVSGMSITIVESKRKLLGVAEAAAPIAEKHGMNLTVIRWEDMSFRQQMEICAKTAVLIVGVGTVRTNSFLLPVGAVEVQTCQPLSDSEVDANVTAGLRRTCFDSHIGTLLSHVRVVHPQDYSEEERKRQIVPASFGQTLEEALQSIPNAPIPSDQRWRQQPPEIANVFQSLLEAAPELLHVQSGWCVPLKYQPLGRMPSDCPPGISCPIISNDMNYFLTLNDEAMAKGCISEDALRRARQEMEKLRNAGIIDRGSNVVAGDNNIPGRGKDHSVAYGTMKDGVSGKLK